MITDKQIKEAIENCIWRKDIGGIYICAGDAVPCAKHINEGLCDTLKELFRSGSEVENGKVLL